MKHLFTTFIFIVLCHYGLAVRYYVDQSTASSGNGLSWSTAFVNLQDALSIVIAGDEIWVAAGQYKPTTGSSRSASFILRDGVNLYGGFAGNETELSERDWTANITALNGDIGQQGVVSDNVYTVLRLSNLTSSIVLDGFRVMNGNNNAGYGKGGGLYYTNSTNGLLTLRNCLFYGNRASNYGAALCLESANLAIESCEFRNNTSTSGNGAVLYSYNSNGFSNVTMKNTICIGNVSRIGAIVDSPSNNFRFIADRCVFSNNTSDNSIFDFLNFTEVRFTNSLIVGNRLNSFSADLFFADGSSQSSFDIINCTIAHNYNTYQNRIQQSLINLERAIYRISNSIIYGNTAYQGRQLTNGPTVSNCLIEGGFTNGTAIINANPEFVDPNTTPNVNFDATPFDYSLADHSPAINVGVNLRLRDSELLDVNGAERMQGCIVDLGAYESRVEHIFHVTDTIVACESYQWRDGVVYTADNRTAVFTVPNVAGCDSIIELNLSIHQPTSGIHSVSTCGAFTWIDGLTYTESTSGVTYVLSNLYGCDSVVTLELYIDPINQPTAGIDVVSACDQFTWIDGITYTQSTNAPTYTLVANSGCDSVVTLHLTINTSRRRTDFITSCDPIRWIDGNMYNSNNSTATHRLVSRSGCDSIITLNLRIIRPTLNANLWSTNHTLTVTETDATYQWYDCATNEPISGATDRWFTPSRTGRYRVLLTSTFCPQIQLISDCFAINYLNVTSVEDHGLVVYPNPTSTRVIVECNDWMEELMLKDMNGQLIFSQLVNGKEIELSLVDLSAGMYWLVIKTVNGEQAFQKVVKE